MAGGPVRLLHVDYVSQPITDIVEFYGMLSSLSASSEDPSMPTVNVREQTPTMIWRSKPGWTFTGATGVANNIVDFTEGGVARVATIASGTYTTPGLTASALQTALNTAPGKVNTYSVTYSTATRRFTVTRTAGAAAFAVQWVSGADSYRSAGPSFGFTANDTGSTSYTSDIAVGQGEHILTVNLVTSRIPNYTAIAGGNVSTSGSITFQAAADAAFTSIVINAPLQLSDNGLYHLLYWGIPAEGEPEEDPISFQYARLKISDVSNVAGYSEIGVWHIGTVQQLTHGIGNAFSKRKVHLSMKQRALDGALHRDKRPSYWEFDVNWRVLTDTQRLVLEELFDNAPCGRAFFFDIDSNLGDIWYVCLTEEQSEQSIGLAWDMSTPLEQVI